VCFEQKVSIQAARRRGILMFARGSERCPEAGIPTLNTGMSGMLRTVRTPGYSPREELLFGVKSH